MNLYEEPEPIPEAFLDEIRRILHESMLRGFDAEYSTSPVFGEISGAACLHGFTIKDVKCEDDRIEISLNETVRLITIDFLPA